MSPITTDHLSTTELPFQKARLSTDVLIVYLCMTSDKTELQGALDQQNGMESFIKLWQKKKKRKIWFSITYIHLR